LRQKKRQNTNILNTSSTPYFRICNDEQPEQFRGAWHGAHRPEERRDGVDEGGNATEHHNIEDHEEVTEQFRAGESDLEECNNEPTQEGHGPLEVLLPLRTVFWTAYGSPLTSRFVSITDVIFI